MDHRAPGPRQPLDQAFFLEIVHQEADRAPVHAEHRGSQIHDRVKGLQHEAVTAQRHNNVGVDAINRAVSGNQSFTRRLGLGSIRGDEGDAGRGQIWFGHETTQAEAGDEVKRRFAVGLDWQRSKP